MYTLGLSGINHLDTIPIDCEFHFPIYIPQFNITIVLKYLTIFYSFYFLQTF